MKVVLKKSSKFLLLWVVGMLIAVQTFAQSLTVQGVVKDNTGEAVIGANVVVKGTTNGTITDFDGNLQTSTVTSSCKPKKAISSSSHLSATNLKNYLQPLI